MLSLIQICITTVTPIPFTCSPGQSQIYFLSLWIYLFWTFHMTGIIQYVAFCNWLISFSIKFSRSIHVAASFRLSLVFFFFFFISTSLLLPTLHPHAHMFSHVTPWTAASQAPLSMDFSRQEYWSGLPFPSPGTSLLFMSR